MTPTESRLAKTYAANIRECARRNDYGGQMAQARRDLTEQIYVSVWDAAAQKYVGRYLLPDGTTAQTLDAAIPAWLV